jgi:uncharacterized protein YdiU (UPF0061 family)
MTLFFRALAEVGSASDTADPSRFDVIRNVFYDNEQLTADVETAWLAWLDRYVERVRADGRDDDERRRAMHAVNPLYVMRNYLAQLAIDAAAGGDYSELTTLLDVMRNPYTEQPGRDKYAEKRPDWARSRVGCSMLSCSS